MGTERVGKNLVHDWDSEPIRALLPVEVLFGRVVVAHASEAQPLPSGAWTRRGRPC